MSADPILFLRNEVPRRFKNAIDLLKQDGSAKAASSLAEIMLAKGALRIDLEGAEEVFLLVENGEMRSANDAGDLPVRGAFGLNIDVAREALEMLEEQGTVDDNNVAMNLAQMVSRRTETILEGQKLEFHLIIRDLPDDREDAVVKVGVGVDTPPSTATFTATISYDDIEDLRAGDLTPQQIVGRLRLRGDASRAMQLGMKLVGTERT